MSHDIEASWAAAELVQLSKAQPSYLFQSPPAPSDLSCIAIREGRTKWPISDGVIVAEVARTRGAYEIAVEYKRPNEGIHGTLTALGQAHAYLDKGFAGSFIIIPARYDTLADPATYLDHILQNHNPSLCVGVAAYDTPDPSLPRPFQNRLQVIRPLNLGGVPKTRSVAGRTKKTTTQWVHCRSSDWYPSLIERYLRAASEQEANDKNLRYPLDADLVAAVDRVAPGKCPYIYLSGSAFRSPYFHDRVWRRFWFKSLLHQHNQALWSAKTSGVSAAHYTENVTAVRYTQADGSPAYRFCGRDNSPRRKLVAELNARTLTEGDALDRYVKRIRKTAHSIRENVDSYIGGLGFIDSEGRVTPLGLRFFNACRRTGDPNTGVPRMILSAALLRNGNFQSLIHYIFRLSERVFDAYPLAFTKRTSSGHRKFCREDYTRWLWERLADELGVLKRVASRRGGTRAKLLDEIGIMRFCGFLPPSNYRLAVGLPFEWAHVQQMLEFDLDATS